MPPVHIKKSSNGTKRSMGTNNISSSVRVYRRNLRNGTESPKSIPTITATSSFSVPFSDFPDEGTATPAPTPTAVTDTSADTDTNALPTTVNASSASSASSASGTSGASGASGASNAIPIPTNTPVKKVPASVPTTISSQNPLFTPSPSTFPTTTATSSPSIPESLNNKTSNAWLFAILAVSFSIILFAIAGFIYRKRRKRNTNNNLRNASAEKIIDNDKEDTSKSNSLTSSINSISSSFKIKKGKVVPAPTSIVTGNNDVEENPENPENTENLENLENLENSENLENTEKPKMPILKRTPTTVSAFREMVDLTDEESNHLRQSTVSSGVYSSASRLSSTPTCTDDDSTTPLHQDRN